jgi:signal transduction histidine kinase
MSFNENEMALRVVFLLLVCTLCVKAQKMDFEQQLVDIEKLTYDLAKFDSVYALADKMLNNAESDFEKGLANLAKGIVITKNGWGYYLGEYAIPYLQEAINFLAKSDERKYLSEALNTLSISYITKYNPNNNFTSAKEMQFLTMALRVRNDPNFNITLPFETSLEDCNASTEELTLALEEVKKDYDLAIKRGDKIYEMYRTEKLAYIYWQMDNNLNRCESLLNKAALLSLENGNEFFRSICLSQLAVYSNKAQEFQKALKYGLEGLTHCEKMGYSFRETIFRDQLYNSYIALGEKNKAIEQKILSINREEEIQAQSQPRRIKMVQDRIKALEYQNQLELELRNKNQRIKLTSLGLAALLLLSSFIVFSNFRLRQKNKEIQSALLSGQSLERKRMAADLHDTLGSNLSSLIWTLDSMQTTNWPEKEQKTMANFRTLLEESYSHVRLLSHNLLPDILKEKGLIGSIKELLRQMNKNAKINFSFIQEIESIELGRKTEFELYSICLELYTNIMNHSNASHSITRISLVNENLLMEISDDGKGYDSAIKEGFGLRNIQERIDSIKGNWYVTRKTDGGTLNRIEVNLKGKMS